MWFSVVSYGEYSDLCVYLIGRHDSQEEAEALAKSFAVKANRLRMLYGEAEGLAEEDRLGAGFWAMFGEPDNGYVPYGEIRGGALDVSAFPVELP